jgi:FixJ family two-component response regulator
MKNVDHREWRESESMEAKMIIESLSGHEARPLQRSRLSTVSSPSPMVFMVGDDAPVWRSVNSMVGALGWRLETFTSVEEFLFYPSPYCPSCLVLDIALPNLKGLGLQKCLAANRAHLPIILVTGPGDVLMTVQPLKASIVNRVTSPENDGLSSAIRHAIECSAKALHHEEYIQALRSRQASLSSRERQVMDLVVAGLLNKQVGNELGISEITVKAHRGKVMQKMKARSFAQLVKMTVTLKEESGIDLFASTY